MVGLRVQMDLMFRHKTCAFDESHQIVRSLHNIVAILLFARLKKILLDNQMTFGPQQGSKPRRILSSEGRTYYIVSAITIRSKDCGLNSRRSISERS